MKFVKKILKIIILFPNFFKIWMKLRHDNCLCLLGTSTYNNLGDHLLSVNSVIFLKNEFSDKVIVEIPTRIFRSFGPFLCKVIHSNTSFCISAGGWMGNLWEEDEFTMQEMLSLFSKHKIFILPQTVYYDRSLSNYQSVLISANRVYEKCLNLTLFVRELNSYFQAKQLLKINKIYLAPDMGLYGNIIPYHSYKNKTVLICFRNDRERNFQSKYFDLLRKYLISKGYVIDEFSTVTKHNISISNRLNCINSLKEKLERADIVFTDRLHGMIFSVVSGCKCVAFDNSNHKISGVYECWLKDNKNILMINDNDFNISLIDNFISSDKTYFCSDWINNLKINFKNMKNFMKDM